MTDPTSYREHLAASETCDWCEEPAIDTHYCVQAPKTSGKRVVVHAIYASVCETHKKRFDAEKRENERRESQEKKRKARQSRQRSKRKRAWDHTHAGY